jgi:hypothetical protein
MKKRTIIIEARVPVDVTGEEASEKIDGKVMLRHFGNAYFLCLRRHAALMLLPEFKTARTPMIEKLDRVYHPPYYGSLVIKIAAIEDKPSKNPSTPLWEKIIIQHLGDGELRVIKPIGDETISYSINRKTNEITMGPGYTSSIITEENIGKFMQGYFGLEEPPWLSSYREQEKMCQKMALSQQ